MSYKQSFIIILLSIATAMSAFGNSRSIPFEYYQGLIFLELQTEGNDTLFCLFDTGAQISAIDESTAKGLGLPVVGSTIVTGTNTSIEVDLVGMNNVRIGERIVDSIAPTSRDLSHSLSPGNRKLDMIAGYDLFENAILEIDFIEQKLVISEDTVARTYSSFIPFVLDNNIPRFSALLDGRLPIDFRLDTGASLFETDKLYINITSDNWESIREKDPEIKPTSYLSATGINNQEIQLGVGILKSLKIGDIQIDSPRVIIQPRQGYFASPEAVGFVSNNLLGRYSHVAIDYVNHRLYYGSGDE